MTDLELIQADFRNSKEDALAGLANLAMVDPERARQEAEHTIRLMRMVLECVRKSC